MYGAVATAFLTCILRGYVDNSSSSPVIPMVLFGSYEDDEIDDGITFHAKDFPYILLIGIIGGLVKIIFHTDTLTIFIDSSAFKHYVCTFIHSFIHSTCVLYCIVLYCIVFCSYILYYIDDNNKLWLLFMIV